jgi:hypothetical protein
MVVNIPPSKPFWTGITFIQHGKGETPEQFESSKDQATFQVGSETHTLVLDGKIDPVIAAEVRPWGAGERVFTDIRELAPKAADIARTCQQSEKAFGEAAVDLGTGGEWTAFPRKDAKTKEVTHYELYSGLCPQKLLVQFAEGGTLLTVNSENRAKDVHHSMSALITPEGECQVKHESVTWQLTQ